MGLVLLAPVIGLVDVTSSTPHQLNHLGLLPWFINGANIMNPADDLCKRVVRMTVYGPTARGNPNVRGILASKHLAKLA